MRITFPCTNCGMELEAEAAAVGTRVECPGCKAALVVPHKGVAPGATIGGFRIKKLLGRGGMGEVWLASQLSLERDVALKILPAQLGMNPDTVKRFLNEVRMQARLGHPNIVPAFEVGEDSGLIFFAMAHVAGESLEARLKREGVLPEAEALRLAAKVGGGLAYAWNQHQLLHRDVKPSNILLDSKGEPHLVDLGLAKGLTDSVSLTMSGKVLGTPNYMSPEQARGEGEIDARTDMYGLGMTLYHMVTGQIPFRSSSPLETMRKQIMETLPDPREFAPSVSESCVRLLEMVLSKAPSGRPATWELLLEDMRRVAEGQLPKQVLGEAGGSVLMVRGKHDVAGAQKRAVRVRPRVVALPFPTRKPPALLMAGVAAGALALLGLGWWMLASRAPGTGNSKQGPPASSEEPAQAAAAATSTNRTVAGKGQAEYQEALEYGLSHPTDFDGAIARFEKAHKEMTGTALMGKAAEQITRLKSEKARAVEKLVSSLKAEAEQAAASGKFEDILKKLEDEGGSLTAETAAIRTELMEKLKGRQAEAIAKEKAIEARQRELAQAKPGKVLPAAANDVVRQGAPQQAPSLMETNGLAVSGGKSPSTPGISTEATIHRTVKEMNGLWAVDILKGHESAPKTVYMSGALLLKDGQDLSGASAVFAAPDGTLILSIKTIYGAQGDYALTEQEDGSFLGQSRTQRVFTTVLSRIDPPKGTPPLHSNSFSGKWTAWLMGEQEPSSECEFRSGKAISNTYFAPRGAMVKVKDGAIIFTSGQANSFTLYPVYEKSSRGGVNPVIAEFRGIWFSRGDPRWVRFFHETTVNKKPSQ